MISAIVLAGGSGTRMGVRVDKLMLRVLDLPLLAHTLLAFQRCPEVDEIILVARADRLEAYRQLAAQHRVTKLAAVTAGGTERQDSVWCGLQVVAPRCEIVLIHDGARALVTTAIISRCAAAARQTGAAIPACRVKDTIKRGCTTGGNVDGAACVRVEGTVDRANLWAAQTPQTFRLELIRRAYEPLVRDRGIVTDDAAAVERLGQPVAIVVSDPLNLKITTPEDLLLAEAIFRQRAAKPTIASADKVAPSRRASAAADNPARAF